MAQGQKPFYLALAVVGVAGVALLARRYFSSSSAPVSIPANVVVTAADTSGFRGYVLGSENAPVEVTEYGDFECPACQAFALMQFPDVQTRLIATGKIRFRYRDYPWDEFHHFPRVASHAAACANDQGHFWEMSHAIFVGQTEWARSGNPMVSFEAAAKTIGLDIPKWSACMKGGAYAGRIQASRLEGDAIGVKSTPSFLIGGQIYESLASDQIVHIVDSLIGAKPVPKP